MAGKYFPAIFVIKNNLGNYYSYLGRFLSSVKLVSP